MRRSSRIIRWLLIAGALIAGAAIAVPFLVPGSSFLPEISRLAGESLGQPVSIADLKAQLLPTPRLVAEGVRIGRKNEVAIGELEIVPDLLSLLSGPRSVRLLRAENVDLKEAALSIPERMPKGGDAVDVRRLVLRDVRLQHSVLVLPPLNFDMELGDGLELRQWRAYTRDGAFKLSVDADASGNAAVKVEATRWRLPLAAVPLTFDSLRADGQLAGKRLDLTRIEGRQYGGSLTGNARIDWRKLWRVSGTATLAGIDLAPAQKALGMEAKLSGRLGGHAKFSTSAKAPGQLAGALALDAPFTIADGVYRGVDLARVGDLTGSHGEGGTTRFDELRGMLLLRGRQIRITDLCAKSSVLVAGGNIEVAPDQALSGRLGVSIAKTGGFMGVPVSLSGTTREPVVRPTRGYTIGAVVGTVILPGVGTALGGSAGGALEGRSADCR